MTPEQLAALAARHGGQVGQATPENPTIGSGALQGPNPDPNYRYTFKDGTYIVLHQNKADDGSARFDVINQGTALKPTKAAGSTTRVQLQRGPDGNVYQYDPTTNSWSTPQGIPADSATAAKLSIAQQRADAATSNASTAAGRAASSAKNGADRTAIAQQNADTAQAKLMWQEGYKAIDQGLAEKRLDLATATQQLTELHQQVTEWLTQRGQDLTYAEGMARDTMTSMDNAMGHLVPNSELSGLSAVQGQIMKSAGLPALPPSTPSPYPYNPATSAQQIATRALANISPAAAAAAGQDPRALAGGAPPTADPSTFTPSSATPSGGAPFVTPKTTGPF